MGAPLSSLSLPLSPCHLSPPLPESQADLCCPGASKGSRMPWGCVFRCCVLWVALCRGLPRLHPQSSPVFIWVPGLPTASRSPGYQARAGALPQGCWQLPAGLGPKQGLQLLVLPWRHLRISAAPGKEQGVRGLGAGVPHPPVMRWRALLLRGLAARACFAPSFW